MAKPTINIPKVSSPTFINDALKVVSQLSTNPKLRGSEALRGLKATVNAQKSLGKQISTDVKNGIVQSITALASNMTVQEGQKQETNRQIASQNAATQNATNTAQAQLESLLKSMYNQGQDGQGQSGSTTDINSKGGG